MNSRFTEIERAIAQANSASNESDKIRSRIEKLESILAKVLDALSDSGSTQQQTLKALVEELRKPEEKQYTSLDEYIRDMLKKDT